MGGRAQILLHRILKLTNHKIIGPSWFHCRVDRDARPCSCNPARALELFFNSALNIDGAGAGVLFKSPSNDVLRYIFHIHFLVYPTTLLNCLHGLRIAVVLSIKHLMVYGDSALVINQLNKDWPCSNKMGAYCAMIRKLEGKFVNTKYHHVVQD